MRNFNLFLILLMLPSVFFSQKILSVNPTNASAGQTLNVTVTGSNTYFTQASSAFNYHFTSYFGQSSITVNSYNAIDDDNVIINVTVPSNCPETPIDFVCYNNSYFPFGLKDALTITNPLGPKILSINPTTASAGQTLNVTVTGSNTYFTQGSSAFNYHFTSYFGLASTTINSYNAIDDDNLVLNVTIPSYCPETPLDFVYYDLNWVQVGLKDAMTITNPLGPKILSVNPTTASAGETLNVTVTGSNTNFTQGSNSFSCSFKSYFGQSSATINSYNAIDDDNLIVNVSIPSNYPEIPLDFIINKYQPNYSFGLKDAIIINPAPTPVLTSIIPGSVTAGQTLNVTITGSNTHFSTGSGTLVDFGFTQGSASVINSLNIINDSNISVNITIPSNTYTGNYNVTTYNSIDGYLTLTNGINVTGLPCNVLANFSYIDNGNGNYTFTNNSLGSIVFQNWNFGDGSQTSIANPNHTFVANGLYTVVLTVADTNTNSGSCFDYHYALINVTGVTGSPACNAGYSMFVDSLTNRVMVVNSSTGTGLSYLWDFGDGNSSTAAYPNHTYSSSGPFYLCLYVNDGLGCVDSYCDSIGANATIFKGVFNINIINPMFVGVSEQNVLENEIILYPNPFSSNLFIKSKDVIKEILVYDLTGKIIITKRNDLNYINLNELTSGMYYIQLKTEGNNVITKKIIKN